MTGQDQTFGQELRRLRIAAGLSLGDLAKLVHYSKGYLSKIETSSKLPPSDLVRRCDVALGANGALTDLAPSRPPGRRPLHATTKDGEVWLMNLATDGTSWFQSMDSAASPAMGATPLLSFSLSTLGISATAKEAAALRAFRSLFDQLRMLGQTASPAVMLPTLITQTHTLRGLAANASQRDRDALLVLSARYAEYAGWMAQESGSDQAAVWWTARAVEMATAGHDNSLASYALVRQALVTLYREDAAQTIELARRAQADLDVPTHIRGQAAGREAQGHALAGDYDACRKSLDEARELLERATSEPSSDPVLGPSNVVDPVAMTTGWCLHDLGRPAEAAAILDHEVDRIPPHALRSRARYGVRQALAHAAAGRIDHACDLTSQLLAAVDVVSSATIATDLRRLARTLSRRHSHPSVCELYPRLTASLRTPNV